MDIQQFFQFAAAFVVPIVVLPFSGYLLAYFGGWTNLAKKYVTKEMPNGESYYFQSGQFGTAGFGSMLVLKVCDSGLGISMIFPLLLGHPPLIIPWTEFHSVTKKRVVFFRMLDVYIGMPVVANVWLPYWIKEHLPKEAFVE